MKGLTAALTPPLPNEKRKMLTPSPAAAFPSYASIVGMDDNQRIRAPRKTILETKMASLLLRKTYTDEMKKVLKRPSHASMMTALSRGSQQEKAEKAVIIREAVACSRPSAPGICYGDHVEGNSLQRISMRTEENILVRGYTEWTCSTIPSESL